jgi:nitrogenase molybdenum-iron protein alpha/beta subunit
MTPTHGCAFMGACRSALGISDSVVIAHSTAGCAHGAARLHMQQNMDDARLLSTDICEDSVIGGGTGKLREAIAYALEKYAPPVIFVVSGCTTVIMEDDAAGVAAEFDNTDTPIILISGAGFAGSYKEGAANTLEALAARMRPSPKSPNSVNLIGLHSDDFLHRGDLSAIETSLGDQVSVNCVVAGDTYERIISAPGAALNVVFHGYERLAEYMKDKFGTPYATVEYPYGAAAASDFVRAVYGALGLSPGKRIRALEEHVYERLSPYVTHIRHLLNAPCAVIGNRLFGAAMKTFLESELGMCAELFCTDDIRDMREIEESLLSSPVAMVFGSSYTTYLSAKLDVPHFTFCYPVTDKLTISPKAYAGYAGCLYLIEDIINLAAEYDARNT